MIHLSALGTNFAYPSQVTDDGDLYWAPGTDLVDVRDLISVSIAGVQLYITHDDYAAHAVVLQERGAVFCETMENCSARQIRSGHSSGRSIRVYSYHGYQQEWDYKRSDKESPDGAVYYGTEVETVDPHGNDSTKNLLAPMKDTFHWERDSSLAGGSPMEMVSQPMTWQYLMDHKDQISSMLTSLSKAGQSADYNYTCGMHIHVSRSAFHSHKSLNRALALVYFLQPEMEKFARREGGMYCSYPEAFRRKCIDPEGNATAFTLSAMTDSVSSLGHHVCVNTGTHSHDDNRDTIEFRIFQSTLEPMTYFASIQFVQNIVKAANSRKMIIHFGDLLSGEYVDAYVKDLESKGTKFNKNEFVSFHYDQEIGRLEKVFRKGTHASQDDIIAAVNQLQESLNPVVSQPRNVSSSD